MKVPPYQVVDSFITLEQEKVYVLYTLSRLKQNLVYCRIFLNLNKMIGSNFDNNLFMSAVKA